MAKYHYHTIGASGDRLTTGSAQKFYTVFGIADQRKTFVHWYLLVDALNSRDQVAFDIAAIDSLPIKNESWGWYTSNWMQQYVSVPVDFSKLANKMTGSGVPPVKVTYDIGSPRDKDPEWINFKVLWKGRGAAFFIDFQISVLEEKNRPYPVRSMPGHLYLIGTDSFADYQKRKLPSLRLLTPIDTTNPLL